VLILDEPANGLDPEGIRWMRELLRGLASEGRTVLVSSHLLSEMQVLADDVVILAAGRLVRQGPMAQVIDSMSGSPRLRVRTPDADALAAALAGPGVTVVFGVGFGALIRSQLGATVAATVLYLVGTAAASAVFDLINTYLIQKDWVLTAQVIVPAVASQIMISPTKTLAQSPPQWVGSVVLIGYGLVAGVVGTSILRRRDVA
jgi:ABC-type multidrug transport system ATPase subunit